MCKVGYRSRDRGITRLFSFICFPLFPAVYDFFVSDVVMRSSWPRPYLSASSYPSHNRLKGFWQFWHKAVNSHLPSILVSITMHMINLCFADWLSSLEIFFLCGSFLLYTERTSEALIFIHCKKKKILPFAHRWRCPPTYGCIESFLPVYPYSTVQYRTVQYSTHTVPYCCTHQPSVCSFTIEAASAYSGYICFGRDHDIFINVLLHWTLVDIVKSDNTYEGKGVF